MIPRPSPKSAGALLFVLVVAAAAAATAKPHKALFIGNSYTFFSSPTELKAVYKALLDEAKFAEVSVSEVSAGGYQLHQHAKDANTPGTPLHTALQKSWQIVVIQEQSQIPAFKVAGSPYYSTSQKSFVALDDAVEAAGATTIGLMTWGRRDGDKQNGFLNTFKKMQAALKQGYEGYASAASTPQRKVWLAPAGLAFEKIYDDIQAAGGDPHKAGSLFHKLYDPDGSHPSVHGSFLAGLVVAATVSGVDVTTLSWKPGAVSEADAKALRAAAKAVATTGPWQSSGGGGADAGGAPDAGASDAGGANAGGADAGGPDAGAVPDVAGPDAAQADTAKPDIATPDTAKTDTSSAASDAASAADAPGAPELGSTAEAGHSEDSTSAGGAGVTSDGTTDGGSESSGCVAGRIGTDGLAVLVLALLAAAVLSRRRRSTPSF